jgi:uncharacterized repeat protein (TIGR01451 family)
MSRSHDDDELDDEDDRPRRKKSDDEDDDRDEDLDDEGAESGLGGWRPVGEAIFWGVIFLGLTLVAFSLGEGIGVKRPLADKGIEPEKTIEIEKTPDPPKKEIDSAFEEKIEPPTDKTEPISESKLDLDAPPKPAENRMPIVPTKAVQPPPEEPTTRLDWRPMVAKAELKLKPKPKPVAVAPPPIDEPTQRLDVEKLTKIVTLVPATHLLNVAEMLKEVRLVPKGSRLDWAAMLKRVTLEPKTSRLEHDRMVKLVTFTPRPKQKPIVEPAAVQSPILRETPAPVVTPTSLQLREIPMMQQVGKAVVMIAKVLGPNERPLADQMVEWTLDRQGVGEVLAVPNDSKVVKPSERPWPTFARTFTAKSPYRLDASLGGAEIQIGETWIAVESASAGGMYAAAQAPAISSSNAGRAGAFLHWDRAKAVFPEPITAQAGGEAVVYTKVVSSDGGSPLPDYRIRYTVTESNGAESSSGDLEAESRGDGKAQATFRQTTAKPGVTRGKIELLGRRPLPGRSAVVLAAGDFSINWTAPTIALASKFPSSWRLGETVAGSVVVQNKGDAAVKGLKVRQEIPSGIRLVSADGGAVDGQGVTWTVDHLDAGAEQTLALKLQGDADGKRSLKVQAMGRSLTDSPTAATEVVIEGTPSLVLSIKDSADPTPAGREFDYDVVIQNHGNAAARDVRVEFAPPVGLEIVSVSGTLGGTVRDGKYTPPPITELPSNGHVTARLRVKSSVGGDARLIVRLRHPSLANSLLEEFESTVVYKP